MRKLSRRNCLVSSNLRLAVQGVSTHVTARENVVHFSYFESDCATAAQRQEKPSPTRTYGNHPGAHQIQLPDGLTCKYVGGGGARTRDLSSSNRTLHCWRGAYGTSSGGGKRCDLTFNKSQYIVIGSSVMGLSFHQCATVYVCNPAV